MQARVEELKTAIARAVRTRIKEGFIGVPQQASPELRVQTEFSTLSEHEHAWYIEVFAADDYRVAAWLSPPLTSTDHEIDALILAVEHFKTATARLRTSPPTADARVAKARELWIQTGSTSGSLDPLQSGEVLVGPTMALYKIDDNYGALHNLREDYSRPFYITKQEWDPALRDGGDPPPPTEEIP